MGSEQPDLTLVLACRDGGQAQYLANRLATEGLISSIVVESGKFARQAKIKRSFKSAPLLSKPFVALDLIALAIYSRICSRSLERSVLHPRGIQGYPHGVNRIDVDDINDPVSIEYLTSIKPDVLIVLGTGILKSPVISIPKVGILNIHGGIVPQYRNVHSDFWALYRNEPDLIGTSILFLDEGIDTGDIVKQKTIDYEKSDGILEVKRKNAELSVELILEVVGDLGCGPIPRVKQSEKNAGFYRTPTLRDLTHLWFSKRN